VKFRLRERFKDRFRSFMPELLVWNLEREICKLQSCSRPWMERMKARSIRHRSREFLLHMVQETWYQMQISKHYAEDLTMIKMEKFLSMISLDLFYPISYMEI